MVQRYNKKSTYANFFCDFFCLAALNTAIIDSLRAMRIAGYTSRTKAIYYPQREEGGRLGRNSVRKKEKKEKYQRVCGKEYGDDG